LIDLHNHLLPGIDDGANSVDVAWQMAQQAVDNGVTHVVCTPHIHTGYYNNSLTTIQLATQELAEYLQLKQCPLKIACAAEVRICPEILHWQASAALPYLGQWQGRNLLLLELPHSHVPAGTDKLIKWLLANNVQPLVAHPERNRDILQDYRKFTQLKNQGCLFQLTAGSLLGRFSAAIESLAWRMLDEHSISIIASDSHNLERRPNEMGKCRTRLADYLDAVYVSNLFEQTPMTMTRHLSWL
jgi:protein-tyrosine phosphatase